MKQGIKQSFHAASSTYDDSALVQKTVAGVCAELVAELMPEKESCDSVLEIGSGTGMLTRLLLPKISPRVYVALDLAMGMLTSAGTVSPSLVRIAADGETCPLRPESVDFLASSSAMQWYVEPERSIPENFALLRPGAGFILALFVSGTFQELAHVSEQTGFGSVLPMREAAYYENLVQQCPGIRVRSLQQTYTVHHASVMEFLKSHRQTGARYTGAQTMKPASRKRLQAFCDVYAAEYEENGVIPATYATLYLWGHKDA